MAILPSLVGLAGPILSAKTSSVSVLVVGSFLTGVVLTTASILYSIPSEILPRKYRPVANVCSFVGAAIGGLFVDLLPLP